MENDNGKSYYGIGLDNSQLEQDAAKANQILHGIDEEAERQSAAVRDLLSNIPTINIDIVSNAPTTLESIDAAFAEIDRVVGENELAIKEQTGASSRCIPFECPINLKNNNCFYTGKKTDKIVIFTKAY